MEPRELLLTAGRAVLVYFFMLFVIRLLGKRSVGAFSAFDLLVALMLGEVVDEIIYGDVTMLQGASAIGSIAVCQFAVQYMTCKNRKLDALFQGKPTVIVRDGELQKEGMLAEHLSEDDVYVQLRSQSIEDIREVKLALVEPNGTVSVIQHEWAEPVQRADLGGPAAEEKRRATGGREEPPPDKDTISDQALQRKAA